MNTQAPLLLNPVPSESFDITTPTDPGYLRGLASEEKAYKASLCMARLGNKIKSLKTPPIVSVFWTKENRPLQRRGIDLVLKLEDGNEVPLQIKSSKRGAQRFERRHKYRRSKGWFTILAKAIVVDPLEEMWVTIKKISEYVNQAYTAIRQQFDKIAQRRKLQAERRHTEVPAPKRFRFLHRYAPAHCNC